MIKLYVGNLSLQVTGESLQELFAAKGFTVTGARVISDREGGRSRGFGFVEFESRDDAERAIGELQGFLVEGRALQVNEARPQVPHGAGVRSPGGQSHSGRHAIASNRGD
jgi:cold-inducible RNA-binding protein